MNHLALYISLIVIICSCNTSKLELIKDDCITKVFDNDEIVCLEKTLNNFDSSLIKTYNKSVDSAYICFFNTVCEFLFEKDNGLNLHHDYVNEILSKYSIINQIETNCFNEIWTYQNGIYDFSKDSSSYYKTFGLNYHGKYLEFLKQISQRDTVLKDYYDVIYCMGDIPPTLAVGMSELYKHLDLDKESHRLIIAIHYITINAPLKFYKKEE